MVKHNYKLSEQDKKDIVISHYLNNSNTNVEALMAKYNLSRQGLYNVINSKKSEQYITEYQPNLIKKFNKIIDKALEKVDAQVNAEDVKALDLVKIIGILYDKSRLEQNLSTSNNSVQVNIKIEK